MAESTVRQFLFSALIFTAVISASFILIGSFLPSEDSGFEVYNTTTFKKFNEIKIQQENIQEKIEKPGNIGEAILDGLIGASWGALKLVWTSATTIATMFSDISNTFGVPAWFTGLMSAIVGITITFALMAAWFKWHI